MTNDRPFTLKTICLCLFIIEIYKTTAIFTDTTKRIHVYTSCWRLHKLSYTYIFLKFRIVREALFLRIPELWSTRLNLKINGSELRWFFYTSLLSKVFKVLISVWFICVQLFQVWAFLVKIIPNKLIWIFKDF